ncbi:MAG: protein-disulfide reductase DsbD domain-containing protein [Chthoniobacteraceae bacterium]
MIRALLLFLLASLPVALAQFGGAQDLVKPELLADTSAVAPGKPFTVLVRMKMKAGWHVYWRFGGDSGAPPSIEWKLPTGFTAGEIQWPLPTLHRDEGDLITNVYEDELLLPVQITPPAKIDATEVALNADLKWLVCEQTCVPGSGEISLTLPVGADAKPANAELVATALGRLPKPEPPPFQTKWDVKPEAFTVKVSGLPKEARVEFFPLPPNFDVKPKPAKVSGDTITVPVESGGAANTAWRGLIVTQLGDGPRSGWMIAPTAGTAPPKPTTTAAAPTFTLFRALWVALLGGLLLNLMPCVLPVIALKIFSFVSQAGEHPERVFRLGLAFVAGVFVFFIGIAALAIGLRSAGQGFFWGMQFADPRLLLGLIALVVIFAMSMFGVFEITLGGAAENALGNLSRRDGYGGAFVHGLFTTLLGTSCTAPLVGPVLGFAVTQPPVAIIAIFVAMAAGMSLPYFLLTWHPAWMRFLPKPGAWMDRFKQLMGFVLLAVAVWLLGVLGKTRGPDAATASAWLLLFLALASWIFGAGHRRWWATLIALLVLGVGAHLFLADALHKTTQADAEVKANAVGIVWEKFSPERVEQARKAGQPVFLDFTAEWCVNCKVNEAGVLNTAPVAAVFKDKGVLTLKADWTDFDPVITDALKKFERIGVPLYVLYRPGEDAPVLFPELLTTNLVLGELAKIAR